MTTMLEKMVAAAVADLRNDSEIGWIGLGAGPVIEVDGAVDLTSLMRAALLAIREPDEAIIAAGFDAEESVGDEGLPVLHPRPCFTAMIDAILNEKPETTT